LSPDLLRQTPIHRWYVFPHSFSHDLVNHLIHTWSLTKRDRLLDPFAGAGTTILAAKQHEIPATGYDLSPLSVFISKGKVSDYSLAELERSQMWLRDSLRNLGSNDRMRDLPNLVRRALPGRALHQYEHIRNQILDSPYSRNTRRFLRYALMSTIPEISKAVGNGGWLRWTNRRPTPSRIISRFLAKVDLMISDVEINGLRKCKELLWSVSKADARYLPLDDGEVTAIITSPPYPNRHDYTRVFGVELLLEFLNEKTIKTLRRQSFQSHPESQPTRISTSDYDRPQSFLKLLKRLEEREVDCRIPRLLDGYFLDVFLALGEMKRVIRKHGRIAMVVGNVQYSGIPVYVDELCAELAQQVGLNCVRIHVARYRGNSAQQMKQYGRCPSRESILVLKKR